MAASKIMYGIDGRQDLAKKTLAHLEGYRGSAPVRIGNGAYDQLQLDIYGELMDSVYLYNKHGSPISYDLWRHLRRLTNWVCDNWQRQDEGIWEVRSGKQHFVYSRLMCWVAIDRALRLADKRSFPADRDRWTKVRDEIYEEIQAKGWSKDRNAFIQYYGSDSLDASVLMMPLVLFMSATDPRIVRTWMRSFVLLPSAASFQMGWCTATTRKRRRTVCRAGKAHSISVRSGWWKH